MWITKRTHHTWKVVKGTSLFNSDLILIFLTTLGLGPRNDVLTNCKAVTLRGGISYLPFGIEIAGGTKTQPCWILTNYNVLDRFRGRSLFIAWGVGGGERGWGGGF